MSPITIACDVDGTLSSSSGPVSVDRLRELLASGIPVVMVSPSGARPAGFPERIASDRLTNLIQVKVDFPAWIYMYLSDNQDREIAKQAGFCFLEPALFV